MPSASPPLQQLPICLTTPPRLPCCSPQLAEGVLKPDTWAAIDDPFDQETDDEAAEEFQHAYYMTMYQLAKQGHPWAQKEYDMMLKKMDKWVAAGACRGRRGGARSAREGARPWGAERTRPWHSTRAPWGNLLSVPLGHGAVACGYCCGHCVQLLLPTHLHVVDGKVVKHVPVQLCAAV